MGRFFYFRGLKKTGHSGGQRPGFTGFASKDKRFPGQGLEIEPARCLSLHRSGRRAFPLIAGFFQLEPEGLGKYQRWVAG